MAAQVLSFFQRSPRHAPAQADWSQQELAEFYRVESALIRAGIRVGTDRGLSDENEPWFVFYRADDGEVVIHFARIDGEYLIAGPAYEEIARGFDFSALVRNMVARHPLIRRSDSGSNLSIHPAALLVAVVGTAFFKTGEARAAETGATNAPPAHAPTGHARPALLSSSSNAGLTNGVAPIAIQHQTPDTVQLPVSQAVLILAAAMFASDYGVDTRSMTPAAQAAISAAAASLDFGPAGAPAATSDIGLALPTATHAVIVDNTPVQTVSTVLSLVAVLASLPHLDEAPVATDGLLGLAQAVHHDVTLTALPAANETANWTIDVRLGAGLNGLPSVEAVQLIGGLAGEAGAQKISVIEVAKLPDVLAELIAKGDHYKVAPAEPPTPLESVVAEPAPATPGVTPTEEAPAPPTTIQTPPEATSGPEPTVVTPIDAKPAPTPSVLGFVTQDLVKQFIDYFVAHTNGIEVMHTGSDYVIFDAAILHDGSAATHLMAMVFHLDDGSAISLVGNHSAFLNDGILV